MDDQALAHRFRAAKDIAREAGQTALDYFPRPGRSEGRLQGSTRLRQPGRQSRRDAHPGPPSRAVSRRRVSRRRGWRREGGAAEGDRDASGLWVVDPIDGTSNFINRVPLWCVSIAYVRQGRIEVGVIYDPNADELFAARRGQGAFCGEARISCSAADSLTQGTVGIGYSTRTPVAPAVDGIRRLLEAGGMYQRNGSGALMLAYVGAGRLLGYLEAHINAWDCLAGILLVEEAGAGQTIFSPMTACCMATPSSPRHRASWTPCAPSPPSTRRRVASPRIDWEDSDQLETSFDFAPLRPVLSPSSSSGQALSKGSGRTGQSFPNRSS